MADDFVSVIIGYHMVTRRFGMSVLLQLDKFRTRISLVLRVRLPYSSYAATYHPLLQGGVGFHQVGETFVSLFNKK